MSYTNLNFPAAFATEGNPLAGGKFPGEFDPYVHGMRDTMDVDDEAGYFSIDVRLPPTLPSTSAKMRNSTWLDLPSWRSLLRWSRPDGIMDGGSQFK